MAMMDETMQEPHVEGSPPEPAPATPAVAPADRGVYIVVASVIVLLTVLQLIILF